MFKVEDFLLLISSILFLSYINGLFYSKTRIPDIVGYLSLRARLIRISGEYKWWDNLQNRYEENRIIIGGR